MRGAASASHRDEVITLVWSLMRAPGRKLPIALICIGVVVLLFGALGAVLELGANPTTRHTGQIVAVHTRQIRNLGSTSRTTILGVEVQVDGNTQVLEANGLYAAAAYPTLPVSVVAEEDSSGDVKRVEYDGKWYGHEIPKAALVAFCLIIGAVGGALIVAGVVPLRRRARVRSKTAVSG